MAPRLLGAHSALRFTGGRGMRDIFSALVARLDDPEALAGVSRPRPPQGGRRAAVLMLLLDADDPDLVFIERAHTLSKHPGQMAFPGGAMDPGDASLVAAALREAQEEIGLSPAGVRVMGRLPAAFVPASMFDVTSVVGLWSGTEPIAAVDAAEVASVQRFRIADLADPDRRWTAQLPAGRRPLARGVPATGSYRGPAFVFDEIVIWGFTAHLTDRLLDLGGWARDWDHDRTMEVPARFLRDENHPVPE